MMLAIRLLVFGYARAIRRAGLTRNQKKRSGT
jgi:hypothetical protein